MSKAPLLPPLQEAFEPPDEALPQDASSEPVAAQSWPWHARLWYRLSAYLPLLGMAALALGTWFWLRSHGGADVPQAVPVERQGPDYIMQGVRMQRFDAQGRMVAEVSGRRLVHFPAGDRLEIEGVRLRFWGPEGSPSEATADRAHARAGLEQVELTGGVALRHSMGGAGRGELRVQGEQLLVRADLKQVSSSSPVTVTQGRSELRAARMRFDYQTRVLELQGGVRTQWLPPARP
jgi:lipopolysaccharide export system protein LptC